VAVQKAKTYMYVGYNYSHYTLVWLMKCNAVKKSFTATWRDRGFEAAPSRNDAKHSPERGQLIFKSRSGSFLVCHRIALFFAPLWMLCISFRSIANPSHFPLHQNANWKTPLELFIWISFAADDLCLCGLSAFFIFIPLIYMGRERKADVFLYVYMLDGIVCAFFAFTVDWRDARCSEMREIASNYNDPLQRVLLSFHIAKSNKEISRVLARSLSSQQLLNH
jgi:hypothetical protein